jgi:tRNA modification GTPase
MEIKREDAEARREILVLNKTDLGEHESWSGADAVRVSCKTNVGFDALADAIFNRVMGGSANFGDHSVAINARHQSCLKNAGRFGAAAAQALHDGLSPEFVAVDLRAALNALGEIVGGTDIENLLDRIFSAFCIGK